jgi:hypothetical protein
MRAARDGGSPSSARAFGAAEKKQRRPAKHNSDLNSLLLPVNVVFIIGPLSSAHYIRCEPKGAQVPADPGGQFLTPHTLEHKNGKEVAAAWEHMDLGIGRTRTINNRTQIWPLEQAHSTHRLPRLPLVGASALWENACV